ncbi:Mini-ribonuclease 3 [Schwartzia succinivorans]|jgi:ribonuclease-3 family protein|uniref:Mini-ribonuclease 3 n=1 Tax=Schwartzia succinivorans DSM 10502 TaxID=1123243 RepID=A0A1M4UCM9_9FIRM|nr:ribonuclease III domain-containing protein [Schwartzia succinivorans]MBQ1470394.1 ribonuclease III [Schwartzia sp. (in: firmicutes)]MBE6097468.1 ribonuclease III [Schwartzia succinivorans]MBQ1917617.1 ribonuclease III [Schwartzia sp. (in: firmicutes)]MBQ2048416.1 ribonuclease III [Schwartzia sp. (in: firmicutes)]MBQ3862925.1 ribonuclease III [Schwartzia sp. (in: firmicutes)]
MKFEMLQKLTAMMFEPDGAGGIRQRYDSVDVRTLSPLVAAYVGDAYFHLFVRGRLLSYEQNKVQVLNRFSAQIVSAVWQAKAYTAIEPMLTDEEKGIFRRGRNAHSHAPRAASVREYHMSTGFEALLGTLYLTKQFDRLEEVTEASFQAISMELMRLTDKDRK